MKKGWGVFSLWLLYLLFAFNGYSQNQSRYYDINQRTLSENAFKTGYYYFNNMDYEASIGFFRESLKIYPDNHIASYWLGRAYLLAGYKDQAIDQWESFLKDQGHDMFLEQELDRLYSENLRVSKSIETSNNYVFLRYLNTEANPVSIKFDDHNRLYVADYYGHKVDIYDTNLRRISTISTGIESPSNISISKNFIFISSFGRDTVNIYDIQTRKKVFEIGGFGFEPSKLAGPMGVFEFDGKIAVVDQSNNRVQIFQLSPKPYFIAEFGKKGQRVGELSSPTDIVLFHNEFWITDKGNQRIQIFDRNGNFLRQIKDAQIQSPNRLFFYKNSLFVVDEVKGLFLYNPLENKFDLVKKPSDGIQRLSSAAIDRNGILFFSEFTNPKLVSFALDVYKLNSLNMRTYLISNENSPHISMKIRAQDAIGQDIKGLISKNFVVEQDGIRMPHIQVTPIRPEQERTAITIMIRNKADMKEHQSNIVNYIEKLLESTQRLDRVRIITYGSESRVIHDFSSSRLSIINSLQKINWENNSSQSDTFDQVLYQTINENRFNDMNNAIIVLDNTDRFIDFPKYSLGTIANYAKNMGVSLNMINFGSNTERKENEYFRQLALETQGIFDNFYSSDKVFDIINHIKTHSALYYTLSYQAPSFDTKGKDIWSQVTVRLNYRSLSGVDKTGYFLK